MSGKYLLESTKQILYNIMIQHVVKLNMRLKQLFKKVIVSIHKELNSVYKNHIETKDKSHTGNTISLNLA